jgi:mRNA interferase RelE/StbE
MRGDYRVQILPSARRELERLQRPLSTRVAEAIDRLSADPRPRGCGKLTDTDGDYRIRVGDYRVLYEVFDNERLVSVYRIRHRSKAY